MICDRKQEERRRFAPELKEETKSRHEGKAEPRDVCKAAAPGLQGSASVLQSPDTFLFPFSLSELPAFIPGSLLFDFSSLPNSMTTSAKRSLDGVFLEPACFLCCI